MPEGHKRPVIKPMSAVRPMDRYMKKSGVSDMGKTPKGGKRRGRKRYSK